MALDKTFAAGEILSAGDVNGHLLSMWIPIDKRVIASGSAVSSVSWQSLDSNFRFFRVTLFAIMTGNLLYLRLNNDSGSNYSTQYTLASGTNTTSSRVTSQTQISCDSGSAIAGQPFECLLNISKPLTTTKAAVLGRTVREDSPATIQFGSVWSNTSALINRIDLIAQGGTMYGIFALEGMRGV
jgi:hypothetical protein